MRALLVILLLVPIGMAGGVGSHATYSADGRLALSTDAAEYDWPEHPFNQLVCFTATNVDDGPIVWPVSIPFYTIRGPAGQIYLDHGQFDGAEWVLEAGASFTTCWGNGSPPSVGSRTPLCAEPGPYEIRFQHVDAIEGWTYVELPFALVAPLGAPAVPVCPVGDL